MDEVDVALNAEVGDWLDLVRTLARQTDLKRNDGGEWWADDWSYTIELTDDERTLLNAVMPEGRP